jgi:hypothetical protein
LASARGGAVATPARSPAPARAPARRRPQAAPAPSPRRSAKRRARGALHSRGAIAWIAVGAVLLAGVVFINLAVLRLNLRLEQATQTRTRLRAENAALESQLSASLASGRIQQLARGDGLVQADPSSIGYVSLAP